MMSSRRQRFVFIVLGFVMVYCLFHLVLLKDLQSVSESIDTGGEVNPDTVDEIPEIRFGYKLEPSWTSEEALRNYKNFHYTGLKCYQDQEFKLQYTAECSNIKFITYKASPDGGFGNKVRAMLSAFLMALLSGRVFLLNWTVPAHWSMSLAQPAIQWDFQNVSKLSSDFDTYPFFQFENLKTQDVNELLASRRSFSVESNSPFYHNILANPNHRAIIEQVFGKSPGDMPNVWNIANGPIFETSLLGFLVHPSANVVKVTRQIQAKFRGNYVISLHVRTWDGCADYRCLNVFIDCGTKSAQRARDQGKSPVVFLAADRQDLVNQLKDRFAENNVPILLYDEIIKHYVDAAGDSAAQKDKVVEKMMADFYLIGEADLFLGTWYSSFSENSGLRTGLETFLFGRGPNGDIYPEWCK